MWLSWKARRPAGTKVLQGPVLVAIQECACLSCMRNEGAWESHELLVHAGQHQCAGRMGSATGHSLCRRHGIRCDPRAASLVQVSHMHPSRAGTAGLTVEVMQQHVASACTCAEGRCACRGASRAVQAATSGIADALGAGMRVTPNPSGARAMYSRL